MSNDQVGGWLPIGDYQVKERLLTGPGAGGIMAIAPGDPARVALLVSLSVGAGNLTISTRPDVATQQGIPLAPTGYVEFTWARHGPLVTLPWFGFFPGLGATMTVIEVRYVGTGGR